MLACAPLNRIGIAAYPLMLMSYGVGSVFIFINFLSLRQSVTPGSMLGRMTSTMRWLILLPAGPGALIGGWLGEHVGLRAALGFAGGATGDLLRQGLDREGVPHDLIPVPGLTRINVTVLTGPEGSATHLHGPGAPVGAAEAGPLPGTPTSRSSTTSCQ